MADWATGREELDKHASAIVAPLNIIQKSPKRSRVGILGHSRQSSSRSLSGRSQGQAQISPPLTPTTTTSEAMAQSTAPQPIFHNYLRAFYHYSPTPTVSSSTDESSITVAIKQGDVILVHSVHPNGWADGTLLASGARGWLPTNYCEPYDHPAVRSLLNALTHLWDLVRDGENGDLVAFMKQDYVRGMIAGIRVFLQRTDCLSRDSQLIVTHIGLRRMRKGLLGDLSSLVKSAKKLQETLQKTEAPIPVYEHMDELVLKSFKLVTRAVRFLDIWATDAVSLASFELGDVNAERPLTPPSDPAVQPLSDQDHPNNSLPANCEEQHVSKRPFSLHSDTASAPPQRNLNRLSVAFSQPSESDSPQSPILLSYPQRQSKRISVTHRVSYTSKSQSTRTGSLASERLITTQDTFLGFIGSFIGLHLQSRSSEELAYITQQSVIACRRLLSVVEEVWERDARRSKDLEEARDTMYTRLTELVQATKDMFNDADPEIGCDVIAPETGKQLVAAATSCVRSAGECAAKARIVIQRIGDFEFEVAGPGLAFTGDILEQLPDMTHGTEWKSMEVPETDKPLPARPDEQPQAPPPFVLSESKPLPKAPEPSPPVDSQRLNLQPASTAAIVESPVALSFRSSRSSIPPLNPIPVPNLPHPAPAEGLESPISAAQGSFSNSIKTNSINASVADTSSTFQYSIRGDAGSVISHTSTRATTPEHSPLKSQSSQTLMSSFGSSLELRSLASDDVAAGEDHLLETTYVHELVYNRDGQISGGSLPALVEQLTTYETTPDAVFVATFYLTFRLFTTPVELAQCLIDRFDYIGDSQTVGIPVRLRVYNAFKGWLESHWSAESDSAALGVIFSFATGKLGSSMPAAGRRLAELTSKVTEVRAGALVPRLISSIGKTGISNTQFTAADSNVPSSIISKSQLSALRSSKEGKAQCSILDFDPMELARQFTIIESRIFCSIQPEELLALEFNKKTDSKAFNVKAMAALSTDLANLVADTILHLEDPKKRAALIKQWVKIAAKCLELTNYDSLMAIICSLNSSMVLRLKRTWELVSAKTKIRLEELKTITDVGRNYVVLRQRLQNHVAPCIPFVGMYLTDLTFIDAGNKPTLDLPGETDQDKVSVINFDKHMRVAKIIGQLQSFQVPYRLAAIPEMQEWMETQIQRVRASPQANVQAQYRRSLVLEPREPQHSTRGSPFVDQGTFAPETRVNPKDKFEFLNFNFSTNNLKGP